MSKSPSTNNNLNNNSYFLFPIFIISGFILIFCLIWEAHTTNLSVWDLIIQFKNSLYLPNHNIFIIDRIGDINALKLVYKILLLTLVTAVVFHSFIPGLKRHGRSSQIVTTIGITGLLLFAGIQQIHRFEHFIYEKEEFGNKTVDEKKLILFGPTYQFSKTCQALLPGHHQGKLLTDFNLSKSPYMFHHRLLSYYLYPNISLRFKNQSPEDSLVLYHKKNPLRNIPDDYKVLFSSKNQNYILAVKKQPNK